MVKKGDIVVAPVGCQPYLTAGKEYEVLEVNKSGLYIKTDDDEEVYSRFHNSSHLNFKEWIIKPSYSKAQAEQSKQIVYDFLQHHDICMNAYRWEEFINHKFPEDNKELKERIQQLENELEKLKSKL